MTQKIADTIDRRILKELAADARITNNELAERVGLSASDCLRRLRRLEETGVIQGYTAMIDPAVEGWTMTAIASVNAAMGPAFSTGPVASDSFIRESTSTLVLPKAPSGSSGDASLWVGMGTSNGDLIQSIADNWQSSSWSVFAYTLLSTSRT